jgi:hypothetical protein
MTDEPRDPNPEPGLPEALPKLAETIQQEIEEVVEHVPQPLRWTVGKLLRLAVLILVGLIVVVIVTAVLYVSNRTEWAAKELALLINQALASRANVVIEIGDIKGNPLTGVRVLSPRVRFRDQDDLPPLLEAPEMRLRYSAWGLATGGRGPIVIDIDRPVIRLARGPDGKLKLPTWTSPTRRGMARLRDIHVRIHDGTFHAPDTTYRIDGLHADAVSTLGRDTYVDVRSMRWSHGPYGSVLDRAALEYAGGDSAHVRIKEVRTRDLALKANIAWKPKAGEAIYHLEVDRVVWRFLHRVTKDNNFNVPGEGRVVVDARGGRVMAGRFEAKGVWDSLRADARGGFVWREKTLRLDPLLGQTQAGDLKGTLVWAGKTWELAADVRRGDPSRWSIIGIRNWPKGNMNGHFRYAVDNRRGKSARLVARLAGSEWAGWRADTGTVTMEFTPVGGDSFRVVAVRRGGLMTLRALTDDQGWRGEYTLARFPLDEWPEGRASGLKGTLATGRGGVESRHGKLDVSGVLEGGTTDWLGVHTARWQMSDMKGSILPVADLDAQVRLEDFQFLQLHWDSAAVPIHVGDRNVALRRLVASAGDTTVTLEGRADWDPNGWRMVADSAFARSAQFDWAAESPMRLSGNPRGVTFERLVARDRDARLAVEGRWAGPGGTYDFTARAERLDLGRLGFPTDWRLEGSGDAVLRVTGSIDDPRWELGGRASAPGMNGHRMDSLVVTLAGGPSRFEVRDARAMLAGGTLTARGEISGTQHPWPDSLNGLGLMRWATGAARWNGQVRGDQLPLDRTGNLTARARPLRGLAGGTVEIAGSPSAPDLSWNVEARPIAWGDYVLDAAAANGRYRDDRLDISRLTMTRAGVVSTITGTVPVHVAVGERSRMLEQPMDLKIDIPSGDLALLPVFVPQIGTAAGKFDLAAHLTGTAKHPELSGQARIREGRGRMAGREEVVENVSADLTLDESRITLEKLTGQQRKRQGAPGTVTGSGLVELSGFALKGYRFNLSLRDFAAIEAGVYGAEFDGEFVVTNAPRVGRVTLPLVEGNVELRRAVVVFDFAKQSQVQQISAATKPLYWLYRIQLNATDNLRWQPADADIEFSADLRLEQTRDSLIIFGDMTALRGTYYYLSNKFTMERVNLTFDNVGGVNPKLDIIAVTKVPKRSLTPRSASVNVGTPAQNESGTEQITVTITGRAAEPVMAFSSENDRDQSEILSALTYGGSLGQYQSTAINFADDWVTRSLNRQLSADLSRVFQGYLNDWAIERESGGIFGGEGDIYVSTTAPLSSNVNVRYRQRVGGFTRGTPTASTTNPLERDVAAEFRINRFFYISSELAQRRTATTTTGTSGTTPEFNVNLKARWEY